MEMVNSVSEIWMPNLENATKLKKGAVSEKERQRLTDGLKFYAEGLRLFNKAHELTDSMVPEEIHQAVEEKGKVIIEKTRSEYETVEKVDDQSGLYGDLAVIEAKAGLYEKAKQTCGRIIAVSSNDREIYMVKPESQPDCYEHHLFKAKMDVAMAMAQAGYSSEAIEMIKGHVQRVAQGQNTETGWLLGPLQAIEDAQRNAGESTAEVRGIMREAIANSRETMEEDIASWYLMHGFSSELKKYLIEHKRLNKVHYLLEIYLRQPQPEALDDVIEVIKDSKKSAQEVIDWLGESGDTKAILIIENHILYGNGWFRWLTGMAKESNINFRGPFLIAKVQQGDWKYLNACLAEMKPNSQSYYKKRFAEIEIAKGNLEHALQLLEPVIRDSRDEVRPLIRELINKAIEQSQFDLAHKYIGRFFNLKDEFLLLEKLAVAQGREGGDVNGILDEMDKIGKGYNVVKEVSKLESRARIYLELGNLDEAEKAIVDLSVKQPRNVDEFSLRLALAHIERGNLEKATQIFKTSTSPKERDIILEGMIEYYADNNELGKCATIIETLSDFKNKVIAWAKVGKILIEKGLPLDEVREMTVVQAKAVVIGGDMEAINALKSLRPDLMSKLEAASDIKK